jgi:hypothetical protein
MNLVSEAVRELASLATDLDDFMTKMQIEEA